MSASKKMMLLAFVCIGLGSLSAHAESGGISGGGGGVTTPPGVAISKIQTAVEDSSIVLYEWLAKQEALYHEETQSGAAHEPVFEKLFGSSPDAFKVMSNLKIEVRNHKPCFDKNGNPVDGSIVAHAPASICISAFRLKDKLDAYNYEYETDALVLHEVSHLLGADESEAVRVQTQALDVFVHLSSSSERERVSARMSRGLDLAAKTRLAHDKANSVSCEDLLEVDPLRFEFTVRGIDYNDPVRMIRVNDSEKEVGVGTQLRALTAYVCSLDQTQSLKSRLEYQGIYDRGFAGNDEVLAEDFSSRTRYEVLADDCSNRTGYKVLGEDDFSSCTRFVTQSSVPVYFHKIHQDSDREREFNEIISFYQQQVNDLQKLSDMRFETIVH